MGRPACRNVPVPTLTRPVERDLLSVVDTFQRISGVECVGDGKPDRSERPTAANDEARVAVC